MATFSSIISQSSDDASETVTTGAVSLTTAIVPLTNTGMIYLGLRFNSVTIPQGAFVSAADIQVHTATSGVVSMDATIKGDAEDNPATFTTTSFSISGLTLTKSNTVWTATLTNGAFFTSPDISAVIQEILNRTGWASGNSMKIILKANSANSCRVNMWDQSTTNCSKIDITYDPVPHVTGVAPVQGDLTGTNTVTITGNGFIGTTSVKFGSTSATNVVVVNGNTITCTAPAHAWGLVDVTVTNASGTSSTVAADNYTYVAGNFFAFMA